MITVLIWLLTAALVADCFALIFLVLIQLPKKEAGAGLAFGAGATDALFGAGGGTVLTQVTKWFAGGFFGLAIVLAMLQNYSHNQELQRFLKDVAQPGKAPAAAAAEANPGPAPATVPAAAPAKPLASTNSGLLTTQTVSNKLSTTGPAEATNKPAAK